MKKYNLSKVKKSDIDFEIYVTKDLSHPNMISLFEYYVDEYNTYLITEYC
jgi:serine/threonine protein kinase